MFWVLPQKAIALSKPSWSEQVERHPAGWASHDEIGLRLRVVEEQFVVESIRDTLSVIPKVTPLGQGIRSVASATSHHSTIEF